MARIPPEADFESHGAEIADLKRRVTALESHNTEREAEARLAFDRAFSGSLIPISLAPPKGDDEPPEAAEERT